LANVANCGLYTTC